MSPASVGRVTGHPLQRRTPNSDCGPQSFQFTFLDTKPRERVYQNVTTRGSCHWKSNEHIWCWIKPCKFSPQLSASPTSVSPRNAAHFSVTSVIVWSYGEFWGGRWASEWSQDYPNQWQKQIRSYVFGKPWELIELNTLSHLESMIMIKDGLFARRQHKSCIASSGENKLHKSTWKAVTKWLSRHAKVTKHVKLKVWLSRSSSLSNLPDSNLW